MKDTWQTPPLLLEKITKFFGAGWFDPCPANPDFDGLCIPWPQRTFINPPFSQYLRWVQHGLKQPKEQIWICHHDSSTQRFQQLLPCATLCLLYSRVSFIDPETNLPGPAGSERGKSQTLIYRGGNPYHFAKVFGDIGLIVREVPF